LSDFFAIETFVANLHPGAKIADWGKFLDSEANGFCCSVKTPIPDRLPSPRLSCRCEQLGGCGVIECHDWYEKLLCSRFEFTFLHNTFVRLVRAFDPVSKFDVFGRHELRHFVGAAAATTKRWSSRSVAYTLTDLKPMLFQVPSPLDFGVGS
jgi:hypothetical protein